MSVSAKRPRVRYYYDDAVTSLDMEEDHVMRPIRVRLTHSLVRTLGLDKLLHLVPSPLADPADLLPAHSPTLIHFLQQAERVCAAPCEPRNVEAQDTMGVQCAGVGPSIGSDGPAIDTPLFPDAWSMVRSYCGASISAAHSVAAREVDVAINWAGGMHHAMPSHCSGFCHANDAVLACRQLRHTFRRVLYVDLDAHHGDGVEAAFVNDSRVMTLSIHQYGDRFFPGTGSVEDVGVGDGLGYAVNVPITAATPDDEYAVLFTGALRSTILAFDPEAVVLQCGADTIFGDPVANLRVSTATFAACAKAVLQYRLPTVLLGGGGYNVPNVSRTWAILTAVALGVDGALPAAIPPHDPYFYPHYCRLSGSHAESAPGDGVDVPRLHVVVPTDPMPAMTDGNRERTAPKTAPRTEQDSPALAVNSATARTVVGTSASSAGASWTPAEQALALRLQADVLRAVTRQLRRVQFERHGLRRELGCGAVEPIRSPTPQGAPTGARRRTSSSGKRHDVNDEGRCIV